MQDPSIDLKRNVEAPRYALLRRLAPAMRHQMAGSFQPITMMAAIIEKRLLAASPDLPALAKTSHDVRAMATAATRSSLDLMGWIAPDPEAHVALDKGIDDALHLVATELSFRGLSCINAAKGVTTPVALTHVRGTVVAALLALTDVCTRPACVQVTAQREGDTTVVTLTLQDVATVADVAPRDEFQISLASYRKIGWDDVRAIAAADGAGLEHTARNCALRLPRAAS